MVELAGLAGAARCDWSAASWSCTARRRAFCSAACSAPLDGAKLNAALVCGWLFWWKGLKAAKLAAIAAFPALRGGQVDTPETAEALLPLTQTPGQPPRATAGEQRGQTGPGWLGVSAAGRPAAPRWTPSSKVAATAETPTAAPSAELETSEHRWWSSSQRPGELQHGEPLTMWFSKTPEADQVPTLDVGHAQAAVAAVERQNVVFRPLLVGPFGSGVQQRLVGAEAGARQVDVSRAGAGGGERAELTGQVVNETASRGRRWRTYRQSLSRTGKQYTGLGKSR